MTDPTPQLRKLYIETVGCQMNMLDSELVVAALRKEGYTLTDNPKDADTVLFNTCSVREHAEHKIYSSLGRLKYAKRSRQVRPASSPTTRPLSSSRSPRTRSSRPRSASSTP